jgi:hypothetical protein
MGPELLDKMPLFFIVITGLITFPALTFKSPVERLSDVISNSEFCRVSRRSGDSAPITEDDNIVTIIQVQKPNLIDKK